MRLRRAVERRSVSAALVAAVAATLVCGLRAVAALQGADLALYDRYVAWANRVPRDDPRITLVEVTEADIQQLGHWPVTDDELSEALERLSSFGAVAIGVDIYRDIEVGESIGSTIGRRTAASPHEGLDPDVAPQVRSRISETGRQRLSRVFGAHRDIVATTKLSPEGLPEIPAPDFIRREDQKGFSNFVVDTDGTVRRALLYMSDRDGRNSFSMSFRLASLYLARMGIRLQADPSDPEGLQLGKGTLRPLGSHDGGYVGADTGGYQYMFDFATAPATLRRFSLTALLSGEMPRDAVDGSIVLFGVTAESVPDSFYTPVSLVGGDRVPLRGLVLHAQAVSQLLRVALEGKSPLLPIADRSELLFVLAASLFGAFVGLYARSAVRLCLFVPLGLVAALGAGYGAFNAGFWIPMVAPALAWMVSASGATAWAVSAERRQRAQLMRLFGTQLSPEVADRLWEQRDSFLDGNRPLPQRLTATVLFADMQGFTSLGEKLEPAQFFDWLNEYMAALAEEAIRNHGVVDKFIGDAIMALFGVPVPRQTPAGIAADAVRAVECALCMEDRLVEINERRRSRGHPDVGIRIGIFTGELMAGSIGSTQRLNYTVIGDTVNSASRLESVRSEGLENIQDNGRCRILIGERTHALVKGKFEVRDIGRVSVKGKAEMLQIYLVTGRTGIGTEEPGEIMR